MKKKSISKTYTAQPVINKRGKIVSGTIRVQSIAMEPGAKYQITITKITEK